MIQEQLPQDSSGIRKLIGDLDAAIWKRIGASDEGARAEFLKAKEDVRPKSALEIAVWNELTAPGNHDALRQYVSSWRDDLSDYAKTLYDALLAESDRRAAAQVGGIRK